MAPRIKIRKQPSRSAINDIHQTFLTISRPIHSLLGFQQSLAVPAGFRPYHKLLLPIDVDRFVMDPPQDLSKGRTMGSGMSL
jgi:hypothetical protein